jgi:hypothetical protein
MIVITSDGNKARTSYFAMRIRLMAKRKLAEARRAEAHAEVRRIDREILALERAQRPALRPPVALRHTRL